MTERQAEQTVSPDVQMPSGQIVVRQDMTLKDLATTFVQSNFFKDTKSASQAVVKIMAGHELGIPPIAAMSQVHVFEGKVELGARLLASLIKRAPNYRFKVLRCDKQACDIEFFERERIDSAWSEWESMGNASFTEQDAQDANLLNKTNWKSWREDMMFARALSRGFRRYCSDLAGGAAIYVEGEISDNFAHAQHGPQRSDSTADLNAELARQQRASDAQSAQAVQQEQAAPERSTEQHGAPSEVVDAEFLEVGDAAQSAESAPDAIEQQSDEQQAQDDESAAASATDDDAKHLRSVARELEKSLNWNPASAECKAAREEHLKTGRLSDASDVALLAAYVAYLEVQVMQQSSTDDAEEQDKLDF